ncbi:hypothetical protein B0H14DRAFT_3601986 [Mycena olivaceomarginata]|nr:hypothetical protein B0H14DRAFT_3601986 [Mycena olivaceomarginata]
MPVGEEDWEDDPNDDPDLESGEADPGVLGWSQLDKRLPWILAESDFCYSPNYHMLASFSQQRLSNTNNMINATNCAVVGVEDVQPFTEADLAEQLALRGRRANASPTDILPTSTDDEIVGKTFIALIAEMIVAFTPGNSGWTDRKNIAGAVADMMPKDRPLPSTASDARPFGLFDVNEGSKKGVVKFLQQAQERSTLPQRIWSAIWRIFVGDWLSSNNLRAARRDRTDDIDAMERLEYVQELSAPFHFALQASHMLMRTPYTAMRSKILISCRAQRPLEPQMGCLQTQLCCS